ncbi:MAG TPA: NPCBM/NEW2 domain-containing protein, partial [Gemmatimonadaceae bacterium]|nr:NPCBM/NEW2 domain-containing protein [Gemmatimonadaceae bacterium]
MSHRASPRGTVRPRLDFSRRITGLLCLLPVLATAAAAPRATDAELARARAWSAAKFSATTGAPAAGGHLQVVEGKGALLKNARPGGPLQVGGKIHPHGLYAGAITRLAVHLPGPAAAFEATVGLDLTWWGRGDVSDHAVFAVEAAGREVGRSERVTVGETGASLRADLAGATDFTLVVANPDAVPARGTAIWAGARVTLRDGRSLWLDELPVTPLAGAPATEAPFSFTYGGRPSQEFLRDWPVERTAQVLDAQRTERRVTYRDPQTGLVVRVVAVEY